MSMSVRFSEEEKQIIKHYARFHGLTISDVIRQSVLEKIEDELDLRIAEKAIKEYNANPKSYTLDEVASILNLK